MKQLFFLAFLSYHNISVSQTFPDFDKLITQEVKASAIDSLTLKATDLLLSTPLDMDKTNREDAGIFIVKWMFWTKDFIFDPDELRRNVSPDHAPYTGVYMACISKYCLENKEEAKNKKLLKLNAVLILLNYAENPNNNLKVINNTLRNLRDARKRGTLEKEL